MTRSRLVVLSSAVVVAVGALVALGAFVLDPARAAVGPLPAEGLVLPADARFVAGFDVKRFVASPLYLKYGREKMAPARPQAFAELEEKTGLNPERDVDQLVVAGVGKGPRPGLALVLGTFDRAKLSRAIETEKKGKVTWRAVAGTTVYLFDEGQAQGAGAAAFLDDHALLLGSADTVEAAVTNRAQGKLSLRSNAALMALLEGVKPGSTFWMVGDQSLLASLPTTLPAPGMTGDASATASINLPPLKSLVVTGDLDPVIGLAITGEAADEAAAKNLADVVRGFIALANLQAGQKPELKQLASAFSVTTEATRVQVNARIPYELIEALQPKKAGVVPPAPGQ